jgi:hypothetical protein
MKRNKKAVFVLAAAALSAAMLTGPALAAQNDSGFAALEGVTAQTLSAEELQSISGALNALDIAAALSAEAAKLSQYPQLAAALNKAAADVLAHAAQLNALFAKLHILTAPK